MDTPSIEILKNNLETICEYVIDIGLRAGSQLNFALQNVQEDKKDMIDNYVNDFYNGQAWEWQYKHNYNDHFKGTANLTTAIPKSND